VTPLGGTIIFGIF